MLKASEFEATDIVFPLHGALAELLCGLSRIAEVANVMTEYVDTVGSESRRHINFECTEKTIQLLKRRNGSFKKKAGFAFEKVPSIQAADAGVESACSLV